MDFGDRENIVPFLSLVFWRDFLGKFKARNFLGYLGVFGF